MTLKSFSITCSYPIDRMATMRDCNRCQYLESASYGIGVINCLYNENKKPVLKQAHYMVKRKDACNFVEDKNFIGDLIDNH